MKAFMDRLALAQPGDLGPELPDKYWRLSGLGDRPVWTLR